MQNITYKDKYLLKPPAGENLYQIINRDTVKTTTVSNYKQLSDDEESLHEDKPSN
jgi:hypothetical protein